MRLLKKERRAFHRNPVELVITGFMPTKEISAKDEFKCVARDISPKGVKLIIPKNVRVGDELILLLDKPLAIKPVLVKGRVAWAKGADRPGQGKRKESQVGVEFVHVTPFAGNSLRSLMDEVEATNKLLRDL